MPKMSQKCPKMCCNYAVHSNATHTGMSDMVECRKLGVIRSRALEGRKLCIIRFTAQECLIWCKVGNCA